MIEKLLPRVLNSSSDNRLKKKTEMNDAYNVVVTEDFEDFDSSTSTGNEGVLKPVKGNASQPSVPENLFGENNTRRVLGSVSDARTGVVYFFVYSTAAPECGVYAYDTKNYFNSGAYNYVAIYTTSEFNFQQDSVIQGDIVHVAGTGGDFRPILYFTDNVNEPRKIDILRAREGVGYFQNSIHEKDLITACPKTPLYPIVFQFDRDTTKQVSDFKNIPGFQFAYQCIYRSGEESAISTYSDIAVPPEYLRQSIYSDQISLSNVCRLIIRPQVNNVNNFTREIEFLRILVRRGNTGAFFVVDEIPYNGLQDTPTTYDFYNDRVLSSITTEEEQKQFDNLPRVAQALAVVENRLFYGNYVEGYDEPNVIANVSARYADRPSDFVDADISVTPVVVPLHSLDSLEPEVLGQRVSGYVFDTSGVANDIPANTFVSVSVTINPGRSYEFYNATESYHATRLTGAGDVVASRTATYNTIDYPASDFDGGEENNYTGAGLHVFGRNLGVGGDLFWQNTEAPEGDAVLDTNVAVTIGSSPASALKFPGQSITFSAEFQVVDGTSDGKQLLLDAITAAFSEDQATPSGVNLVSVTDNPFITWDHGFLDPEEAPGPLTSNLTNLSLDLPPEQLAVTAIMPKDGDLDLARLIVPVCNNENDSISNATNGFANRVAPRGYFIVNSATAFFRLRRQSHINLEANQAVMTLEVSSLAGVDVRTCIPVVKPTTLRVKGWRVYSGEYLNGNFITDVSETGEPQQPGSLTYIMTRQDDPDAVPSNDDRAAIIGYLHSENSLGVEDDDLYRTNNILRETDNPPLSPDLVQDTTGFSLVDGEAGLLVRERDRVVTDETFTETILLSTSTTVTRTIEPGEGAQAIGCYGFDQMFGFAALKNEPLLTQSLVSSSDNFDNLTVKKRLNFNVFANQFLLNVSEVQTFLVDELIDPEQRAPFEISYNAYIDESELAGVYRSFKTHANHDFGIVYYDERGRPGNVNRLDSVYVNGYSNLERGSSKGRVEIIIELQSSPPTWAHHYQIVYAGNSSVRDFIQYSTGGAFKPVNVEADEAVPNKNIYVSLNYLQENALVSYSRSFGAVATDGTQNLYVFAPGDYLRIVSYYLDEDTVVYPSNEIFEIADVVNLGSEPDENPLVATGEVPPHLQGQFLVLTDNDAATGFSFADVAAGNNEVDTAAHYWNNRCVVELVSPRATVDPEERVYHEIGQVFNVGRNSGGVAFHQTQTIVIDNGDVWWRRVPVNITSFDAEQGSFLNLIREDGESTQSAFRNYYLESKTFNDTFPGTDVNGFGKRKFISTVSNEVRRFSSVTFSDQNDYSTQRLRFTSFNPFNAPFKDLPNEHGNINSLLNFSDSLFVVQENKASAIPVSRNILSDALGQDTLITTDKVLGKQVFYAGSYGSDNNPESVLRVDNSVYFAHKSRGEVYKFNPSNGIQVISRKGMGAFFRSAFQDVIDGVGDIRVVSGYDPLKDEYVITISNFPPLAQNADLQYTQPSLQLVGPGVDIIDFGVEDDSGPGLPSGDPEAFNNAILFPAITALDDAVAYNDEQVAIYSNYLADIQTFRAAMASETDFSQYLNGSVFSLDQFTNKELTQLAGFTHFGAGGDAYGPYDPSTNSVTFTGTFQNLGEALVPIVGQPGSFTVASQGVENYWDFVEATGSLSDIPQSTVRTTINAGCTLGHMYDYLEQYLVDLMLQEVSILKSQFEETIVQLINQIPGVITELQSDIAAAGLGSDPNVSAFSEAASTAATILTDHFYTSLGGNSQTTINYISSQIPSESVLGFSNLQSNTNIEVSPYPYTDEVFNDLNTTKTLLQNLASPIAELQTFGGIDISNALQTLINTNASLRQQVDVLTNQVQNLSVAPVSSGIDPLIDGIQPAQLTDVSLGILSGDDNQLTFDDVQKTFSAFEIALQFLIDNSSTLALNQQNARVFAADVIRGILTAAGLTTDPNFAPLNYPGYLEQDDDTVLKELGRQANPLDFALTGGSQSVFDVSDIGQLLSFFNPNQPFFGAPITESGSRTSASKLFDMVFSDNPYQTYLQDFEDGFAGIGSGAKTEKEIIQGVIGIRTQIDGTLEAAIEASDLSLLSTQPEDIGASSVSNIFLSSLFPEDSPAYPFIVAADLTDIENQRLKLLDQSTKVEGGYLSQFGINIFSSFGEFQDINRLSEDQLNEVITNSINNIQNGG